MRTALGMASAKGELSLVVAKGRSGCWRYYISSASNTRCCNYRHDFSF
jgi:hypothetical protein